MESGHVVEFIDNQKIVCAVILEIRNLRLHLLAENNRDVKMALARLSHRSTIRLDPSTSRDKLVTRLKEIAAHRRELAACIDLQSLWEVLNSEQEWIDVPTMTALCFPNHTDDDHEAAVIRAIFKNRLYFKFNPERFFPHTEEQVAQLIAQQKAAEHRALVIEQGGQWVRKALKGRTAARPAESAAIVKALASFFLFEKESPHRETAKAILKKAGVTPSAIFTFLVKIGVWHQHENIELIRQGIPVQLSDVVLAQARDLNMSPRVSVEGRQDLRSLQPVTIDGPGTLDYDDAISLSMENGCFRLGIHIADVAHHVARATAIDTEAMARASSIYMPDQKIPMLPQLLSENLCSLKAGEDRPAISTLIDITPDAGILDYKIVPSVVRITRQLSYQDVDTVVREDPVFNTLHTLAKNYRRRRLDSGALMIDLPEIAVWLNPDGDPSVSRIDRESPGRMLVAELMIMGNELAARYLADNGMPAIFRSQAEPRERLVDRDQGSLFQNWMQRRLINRFILASNPGSHSGLGLPAYVTASSPIRKYTDLITQRQLRALHGLEPAYPKEEIDRLIPLLQESLGRVGRVQYQRQRYWLLKYLESRIGKKEEGLILYKRGDSYAVLLPAYMIECRLSGAEDIKLKPEDLVQITLQHVNARNDVISVYLG